MKTVKQQAEVSFNLLDFADKVVMLPIMDMLEKSVKESLAMEIGVNLAPPSMIIHPEHCMKILKTLSDLGCRTSHGKDYEDIMKSYNSQENTCILFLRHRGDSPLPVVKLVRETLNLGVQEAKDLVDSYPIKIDLSEYSNSIKPEEYKNFAKMLEEKGAIVTLEQKKNNKQETVTNTSLNWLLN